MKLLALLPIFLILSCGNSPSRVAAPGEDEVVQQRMIQLRSWAPLHEGYPTKRNPDGSTGDNGDMVLFNGMLCASGEVVACEYVRESQLKSGPNTGRFFRSPHTRIKYELDGIEPNNAFSRDMSLGVMLYIWKTQDREALSSFIDFIKRENGQLCFLADDSRCDSGLNIRYLLLRLAEKLGVSADFSGIGALSTDVFNSQLLVSAQAGPAGFPRHLIAVQLFLLKEMSLSATFTLEQAREALHKKSPQNAFFAWLVNQSLSFPLFIKYAPTSPVEPQKQRQWSIERTDSESAHKDSMGWEFIFVGNLILRRD